MAESLFGYGHTSTQIKNSNEDEIFFRNDFIPRYTIIQGHNSMLLWMTIIYGFIRMCVKPSSAYIDNAKQRVMV